MKHAVWAKTLSHAHVIFVCFEMFHLCLALMKQKFVIEKLICDDTVWAVKLQDKILCILVYNLISKLWR